MLCCEYRSAVAAVAQRQLQTPHGGELVDLMAPAGDHEALKAACTKSIELSDRNACDVEPLTVGCPRVAVTMPLRCV